MFILSYFQRHPVADATSMKHSLPLQGILRSSQKPFPSSEFVNIVEIHVCILIYLVRLLECWTLHHKITIIILILLLKIFWKKGPIFISNHPFGSITQCMKNKLNVIVISNHYITSKLLRYKGGNSHCFTFLSKYRLWNLSKIDH